MIENKEQNNQSEKPNRAIVFVDVFNKKNNYDHWNSKVNEIKKTFTAIKINFLVLSPAMQLLLKETEKHVKEKVIVEKKWMASINGAKEIFNKLFNKSYQNLETQIYLNMASNFKKKGDKSVYEYEILNPISPKEFKSEVEKMKQAISEIESQHITNIGNIDTEISKEIENQNIIWEKSNTPITLDVLSKLKEEKKQEISEIKSQHITNNGNIDINNALEKQNITTRKHQIRVININRKKTT